MVKQLVEIENPMVLERPIVYEPPVKVVKPEPKCACCGKEVGAGSFQYFDDYLCDKDCWWELSLKEKWLKEVG